MFATEQELEVIRLSPVRYDDEHSKDSSHVVNPIVISEEDLCEQSLIENGIPRNSRGNQRPPEIDDDMENETSPWFQSIKEHSLPEYNGQIAVPRSNAPWYKQLSAFLGPGSLIAVGYMDPGNWVTDLAGGSAYGYRLLFVIALSSVMAMFLQYLALKAGLATSRDLAQICRDSYHPYVSFCLWIINEIAICATGKRCSLCPLQR